jgi:general L-amino acid transport system substrate-binding protein
MPGPPAAPPQDPDTIAAAPGAEPADSSAGRRRNLALIGAGIIGLIVIIAAVIAFSGILSASDGDESGIVDSSVPALQTIRDHGHIHVGIRDTDLFPFTFRDGEEFSGFEIDIARELVQRVFGDSVPIDFQPLSDGSGLWWLKSGEIDMLLRMMTKTNSRIEDPELLFSNNYFLDGQRLLVPRQSGISDWDQLDGRVVCVLAFTTHGQTLDEFSAAAGINLEVRRFANSAEIFNALQDGQCVGYSADWSTLEQNRAASGFGDQLQIVGGLLTREPVGIAFGDDIEFASLVDQMLLDMINEGTWQEISGRWFGDAPPWTVEEMLSEPPADR